MKILTMPRGKHSKPCPRQGRTHRHCIDSLQIPITHPLILPRPCRTRSPTCQGEKPLCGIQPPDCKVMPPQSKTSHRVSQDPPLVCQNPANSCFIQPPAPNPPCKYPPLGKTRHPDIYESRPPVSQNPPPCQISNSSSQDLSSICQVTPQRHDKPPACHLPHSKCQADSNAGQIRTPFCQVSPHKCPIELPDRQCPPPICHSKPFSKTKQPLCQWDRYQSSADYDDEDNTYNECYGKCIQLEDECQNVKDNLDQPYLRETVTLNTNQQDVDESYNEDFNKTSPKRSFYTSTPKGTHQNNGDDIENSSQIEYNLKKCTQAFLNRCSNQNNGDDIENSSQIEYNLKKCTQAFLNRCSEDVTENTGQSKNASVEPNYENASEYSTSEAYERNQIHNYENTARNSTAEYRERSQNPNHENATGFPTPQRFDENQIPNNYQKNYGYLIREHDGKNQIPYAQDTAGYSFREPYGGNKVSTYQDDQDAAGYFTLDSYEENHIRSNPTTDGFSAPDRYIDKQIPAGYYTPERYEGSQISRNIEIDQSDSIELLQSTGFTTPESFGGKQNHQNANRYQETNISNNTNVSQFPKFKRFPKNDNELPVFEENSPLNSINYENRSSKSMPNSQPGFLQEKSLGINLPENDKYNQATPDVHDQQTGMDDNLKMNKHGEMCHKCCGASFQDSTSHRSGSYTIIKKVHESKTSRPLARNSENIPEERNKKGGSIEAISSRRSTLKNPSSNIRREGTKNRMQDFFKSNLMNNGNSCEIADPKKVVQRDDLPDHQVSSESKTKLMPTKIKSQSRFAVTNDQSDSIDKSVLANKPKKFAECSIRGISKATKKASDVNADNAPCTKKACIQKFGVTKSCESTSCVANNNSGCSCRYPPAFKQFSCTGDINGTCDCRGNNKI